MSSHVAKILQQKPQRLTQACCRTLTTKINTRTSSGVAAVGEQTLPKIGEIQTSLLPSVSLPNTDVFSYAFSKAKNWEGKTYTECGFTGRSYTFGETIDASMRWVAALKKLLPNEKNPTVAFITPNSPDYVTMFFGCCAAGAIVSPINPMYTPGEIACQLNDNGASLLVIDSLVEPLADAAFQLMGRSIPVVVNGHSQHGRPNAHEFLYNKDAPMGELTEIDPASTAFLPYSSGTTGKPKGVRLSHAAITSNMAMLLNEHFSEINDGDQYDFLGILPFFHIYGMLTGLLPSAFYGQRLVTMPLFDPTFFVSALKKMRIKCLPVVPSLFNFIADCPHITNQDLRLLSTCIVGAAPVNPDLVKPFKEKAPNSTIQEGYGMTETLLTHGILVQTEKLGYFGQLFPNVSAKIVDIETGEVLPANTPGELYVKTPSIMSGYHNNEAATKETIDEEGWCKTGDVAIYTEDGYYAMVDRLKELIKVKGMQVSPSELEETLKKHPGIADVGVVGVPHEKYGEAPAAFIVKTDPDLTEANVNRYMAEHLSRDKQLAGGITFVDELPKNLLGKLLRKELKEMAKSNQ